MLHWKLAPPSPAILLLSLVDSPTLGAIAVQNHDELQWLRSSTIMSNRESVLKLKIGGS
jgi:hypothetical protein